MDEAEDLAPAFRWKSVAGGAKFILGYGIHIKSAKGVFVKTADNDVRNDNNQSLGGTEKTDEVAMLSSCESNRSIQGIQPNRGPPLLGSWHKGYILGNDPFSREKYPVPLHSEDDVQWLFSRSSEKIPCTKNEKCSLGSGKPMVCDGRPDLSSTMDCSQRCSLAVDSHSRSFSIRTEGRGCPKNQDAHGSSSVVCRSKSTTNGCFDVNCSGRENCGEDGTFHHFLSSCNGHRAAHLEEVVDSTQSRELLPIFRRQLPLRCRPNQESHNHTRSKYQNPFEEALPTDGSARTEKRWTIFNGTGRSSVEHVTDVQSSSVGHDIESVLAPWTFRRGNCSLTSESNERTVTAQLAAVMGNMWPSQLKKTKVAGELWWNLPLHVKNIQRLNWDRAESIIIPEWKDQWNYARKCMFDEQFLRVNAPLIRNVKDAFLSEDDISSLLQHSLIEPHHGEILGTCNVFSVLELEKGRRRMIVQPMMNETLLYAGECTLPSLQSVIDLVLSSGARSVDFASFYHQFELPVEVRKFFCFRHKGRIFRLTTIPTGMRQCPVLAHSLTASLTATALSGSSLRRQQNDIHAQENFSSCVKAAAYIDNVAFAGEEHETALVERRLREMCEWIGITLNDQVSSGTKQLELNSPSESLSVSPFLSSHDFLGIRFNHSTHTVSLSGKTQRKLEDITALWENDQLSIRDVLRTAGLLVWACRILAINLGRLYYVFKFLRRRKQLALDDNAYVWQSLRACVKQLCKNILHKGLEGRDVKHPQETDCYVVFSDASESGYGVVGIPPDGRPWILAGRFNHREYIGILEARAAQKAVQALPYAPVPTRLILYIDNTSLAYGIEKGISRNFLMNVIVMAVREEAQRKNWILEVRWIPSEFNLADIPSRIHQF